MTSIEICNLALRSLGADRITSLSDDNERARILNDIYTGIRDELVASHPWNFAIERATMALDATAPDFDYDYSYTLPVDCLRAIRLSDDTAEFKIEAGHLFTDDEDGKLLYIKKVTDTSLFSPKFATALAARLAAEIAFAITNSRSMAVDMWTLYDKKLAEAKAADAQEGTTEKIEDSTWIDDRE